MSTATESKHTPGPWRMRSHIDIDKRDRTKIVDRRYSIAAGKQEGPFENKGWFHPDNAVYFNDEIDIVEIYYDSEYDCTGGGIENKANAQLIAAAPAMLEALESLPLESFGDDMGSHDAADFVDHAGEIFHAITLAKDAIRLAKGEE